MQLYAESQTLNPHPESLQGLLHTSGLAQVGYITAYNGQRETKAKCEKWM